MSPLKVLLVDDEEMFTEVLAERMETRGLVVDTIDNGKGALKLAKKRSYDAVVLDLAMPEMDGIETLKRLLRNNPNLQVILLTGQASLEKGIEAMKHGAMEFMQKPVDIDALIAKIEVAHDKREQLTELRIEETLTNIMGRKGW
ncbi:response regulator [bacterium]|nr:response regulator [bacterium]